MSDDIVNRLKKGTNDGLRAWDWMCEAADEITRLRSDLAAVTEERDRMREALEFYGWAEHWVKQPYERSVIEDDNGRRARAALEGVKKKEGAGNE